MASVPNSNAQEGTPDAQVDNTGVPIEADDESDHDSAFGDGEASSTTSISSSILKYREENGRTYHAYKELKYVLPNDEHELDRLDLQHHLFLLTQQGKLFLCPIPKEQQLHRVLDVGTGTGIWAIDFADEHPETQVLGIDLSPTQPSMVPPNLNFQIDDLEDEWVFSQKFDFIYSRMLVGSFANWPRFFEQAYENLTPGGWMEVTDICFPARSDDNSWPPGSALKEWSRLMIESAAVLGRFSNSAASYKEQMEKVGFENVTEIQNKWPTRGWPKDPKMKELGMWNKENMLGALHGISVALFTRGLGWSNEELEVFLAGVRKEWVDPKVHVYFPIYTVYAQKPKV
ncbi:S-adenosyl-L-methionine-dependent methyltransferase [Rhexocercosporidium sp. MPI-PUGE-AT-0058]|nr:S-adenosyl-L-methionine-dependent methyltransferase [Rhexocercosporidium sp. MPI-PUGE-AT-0058]